MGATDHNRERTSYSEGGVNLVITAPGGSTNGGVITADITGAAGENSDTGIYEEDPKYVLCNYHQIKRAHIPRAVTTFREHPSAPLVSLDSVL